MKRDKKRERGGHGVFSDSNAGAGYSISEKAQRSQGSGCGYGNHRLDAHKDRLRLVQIGAEGMPVLLIDCFSFLKDSRGTECLREILEGEAGKIFHNAKFDLQFLRKEGILPENILDTMLAAELLRPCGGPRKVSLRRCHPIISGQSWIKRSRRVTGAEP